MKNWVIVASAARARIFEVLNQRTPWVEIMDLVNADNRLFRREMVSDKPGRAVDKTGGQRHAMEPPSDTKEQAAAQFAKELVEKLETALYRGEFEGLTVVAPPHFLGLLRGQMSSALAGAVTHELNKDLTREAATSLPTHLAQLAA
jgi:protein required for attachment to host cells